MRTLRILGLGTSLYEAKPIPEPDITVWGLQYVWKSHKLHRAFMMDDREWIVAKNNNLGRNIQEEINSYDFPIYTAKLWGDLDRNVEFPLEHVISCFPNLKHRVLVKTDRGEELDEIVGRYFLNTFCYMIALAIFEGYERIELYGIDMANSYNRAPTETWEDERACVAYWLGVAVGRGIEVSISRGSRMTKPIQEGNPSLYGYEVSNDLQKIRDEVLKNNNELEHKLHSGKVEKIGNDTIIDMTNKNLKLDFYRAEDWPDGIKPGDISAPKAKPYYSTNEHTEEKI